VDEKENGKKMKKGTNGWVFGWSPPLSLSPVPKGKRGDITLRNSNVLWALLLSSGWIGLVGLCTAQIKPSSVRCDIFLFEKFSHTHSIILRLS
jgi:hypothetical protein